MLLRRSSPDEPRAAARVAGLLQRPGGGWLPPPEPGDAVEGAEDVLEPELEPDPVAGPSRSWGSSVVPATLRGGRLDPGGRGVAALVVVALVAALVTGAAVLRGRPQEVVVPEVVGEGEPLPGASATPSPAATEVVVAVAGTVVAPGLVRLPAGSRVDDAVRAAGGVTPGADVGLLNLARPLVDGEQVLVGVDPPPGVPPQGAASGAAPSSGGLVDLNAATGADFDGLPGIGPVLAQRIVDWRTENGPFASVDQLREVTGIGESKYRDLEDKVTV